MCVSITVCDAFGQFHVAVTLTFFILNLVVVVCINNVLQAPGWPADQEEIHDIQWGPPAKDQEQQTFR